jgi:hypothetical protein
MQNDNVKSPKHYVRNGLECVDAIKAAVSGITDPFEAYCTGNIIKYSWRWAYKNGVEDLEKAKQYADFIIAYRKDKPVTVKSEPITEEIKEELFAEEPVKGKYEGLSNRELYAKVCEAHTFSDCDGICMFSELCDTFNLHSEEAEETLKPYRLQAIPYLEGLEAKN